MLLTGALILAASIAAAIPRACPDCPDMIAVPGGSFLMGSPASEPGRTAGESLPHSVMVARFAIAKYDVTRAQYARFVAETGGGAIDPNCSWIDPRARGVPLNQGPNDPVVCVSWRDASAYADWLSRKTHRHYRLPSEAEWEYAARAGSAAARPWGDAIAREDANYGVDSCCGPATGGRDEWRYTSPVGSFPPNKFGLYDVIGDVWQWTADCGDDCEQHILHGGSWFHGVDFARSAARASDDTDFRVPDIGFRVACDL
jgi:formylglycine-generating enzyme required for sulfatase activity